MDIPIRDAGHVPMQTNQSQTREGQESSNKQQAAPTSQVSLSNKDLISNIIANTTVENVNAHAIEALKVSLQAGEYRIDYAQLSANLLADTNEEVA